MKAPIRIASLVLAGQIVTAIVSHRQWRYAETRTAHHPATADVPQAQQRCADSMELEDCVFPMLQQVVITDDPSRLRDAEIVLLVGARPRSKGMERKDLIDINAGIFAEQGKFSNAFAAPHVKVLVVGNPANTNALIVIRNAPEPQPEEYQLYDAA